MTKLHVELDGNVIGANNSSFSLNSTSFLNLMYKPKFVNKFMIIAKITIPVDTIPKKVSSIDPNSGTECLILDIHIKPIREAGACKMLVEVGGPKSASDRTFLVTTGIRMTAERSAK